MGPPKLTLYVDTVSPFAYLAYHILREKNDPAFSKCEITYVPIFLGGVMKACGNTAPMNIKNKGAWLNRERTRWAQLFSVPMVEKTPPGFPHLTLTIMRALCAVTVLHPGQEGQELLVKCLDALFPAYWVDNKKTYEKEVLAEVLSGVLGAEETKEVLEVAGKEGKETLAKNSDKAFADGAFGLPWFVATNAKGETETFWGVDHLAQVTNYLGIGRPTMGGGGRALL